ncbi:DUF6962 family protein [Imhoffiella purpurea]|uniref:Uncharacterized protein n=1 Tax=Imhoffiella purpurea TaxID=1249627 RepID=W9VFM9_9GAMM|nr:hypothetical protein [Imhoffiella purpurea]EXJ14822.1 hypothetical protein D779_2028 [Imhoffiella purpurea]
MTFVQSQTEMTTAVTDLVLTLVSLFAILWLLRTGTDQTWKRGLWIGMLALLAVSGVLGAGAHGLVMTDEVHEDLWRVLNLLLILLITCFGMAAILDRLGPTWMFRLGPLLLALGLGVYASLYLLGGTFLQVILYEGVVMASALGIYVHLAWRRADTGFWMIAVGLAITIVAAVAQAQGAMRFRLIWEFDHNGIFHLIQILGIPVLIRGVVMTLGSARR